MDNRTVFDFPLEIRAINSQGEFEGYASVFDVVDTYNTAMQPGCFRASLAAWSERKRLPPLLWQHKTDEPIGIYTDMREDAHGLKVKGQLLINDDPLAKRAYAHLKAGSINGLSIGFKRGVDSYDEQRDITLIHEIDLLEVSLVTFPSNESATITTVRDSSESELPSPRQLETILRDAGLSRRQAKAILSDGYKALSQRDADEDAGLRQLLNTMNNWSFTND